MDPRTILPLPRRVRKACAALLPWLIDPPAESEASVCSGPLSIANAPPSHANRNDVRDTSEPTESADPIIAAVRSSPLSGGQSARLYTKSIEAIVAARRAAAFVAASTPAMRSHIAPHLLTIPELPPPKRVRCPAPRPPEPPHHWKESNPTSKSHKRNSRRVYARRMRKYTVRLHEYEELQIAHQRKREVGDNDVDADLECTFDPESLAVF